MNNNNKKISKERNGLFISTKEILELEDTIPEF